MIVVRKLCPFVIAWSVLAAFGAVCLSVHGQVLFDDSHSENVANANWIIDTSMPVPSPTISNITATTSESYWTGALSSWGVALAKLRNSGQVQLGGNGIESLPTSGSITYGDSSNSQDLSHYQAFIVCEPNTKFTTAEKTAILTFVANGGGLFMVADHAGSDRNSDGWDSLMVWNDLMTNNAVQNNPFGFIFNSADVSPSSPTADSSVSDPLTHGIAGTVSTLTYASGTTMTINNATTTHAAVWSASSTTGVMALYGTYGAGRFAAIGDSSVVEDATSSSGTTYAGWTTPADNGYCALNGTVWILNGGAASPTAPTATTGAAGSIGTITATLNGTVNPGGQSTTAQFQYGLTTAYGSTAPVSGTLTSATAQAVSANLTGLTPGTTYHFRLTATNASGSTNGLDAQFKTAAPDLAILKSHTGNFIQGDVGDIYTLIVTNVGNAASSGSVSVADALPSDMTATAISGTGWTATLGTLTCTRSDALAAGAAYPPITVTVNIAAGAAASVTNTATVSGGSDANLANNTAADPTTIIVVSTPTITTGTATPVGTTTATLHGTVNPNGLSTTAQFQYGLTTAYGSTNVVSGPLTGTSAQAVSASLTGLTPGQTYHFRVSATNSLGAADGTDQTFTTTALVPDLAISLTHAGNFTQGDVADTYTILVTNLGSAVSSGTVTVTDTPPAGLTIVSMIGSGWNTATNGSNFSCSRSDALAAGAAYSAITVTVSVSASAPSSGTNVASVSGGGESNTANNTASDPTTIISGGGGVAYAGVLAGWNVSSQSSYGTSPLAATTNAPNLTVGGLTRGSGVGTSGTASSGAWGGNTFASISESAAVSASQFATFSIAASAGYKVSLTNLSRLDYRRSNTGPPNGALQYRVGAGGFVDIITNLSYTSTTGASLGPINLAGIAALQNVGAGTNVTLRIVNWGASGAGGTWYILDVANSTADDLEVQGTVSPVVSLAPDLTVSLSHSGSFTQGDAADTYTIIVTNIGTAASSGTVTVTETPPAGLTVTGMSGTGWSVNLGTLTCTRADALAVGGTYPPITVTVSVATNAAASLTNTAIVSGGGDVSAGNNTALDATTILVALKPIESWRLLYFGTTTNSGAAANTAIATSDGMANLLKYALGLNPLVAAADPIVGDITTGYLHLTLPRDPAATDVSLYVEVATDVRGPWTTNGITVDINTPTQLQAHYNTPVDSSAGAFIRLRVAPQ